MSNWAYPTPNQFVTSRYNPARRHPITGRIQPHWGTDYRAPEGSELYAAHDGVVTAVLRNNPVAGNWVQIKTDDGRYFYEYSHMSSFNLPSNPIGYKVRKGQVIGRAGSTGGATAAHLHFGLKYPNGIWLDPDKFLRAENADRLQYAPSTPTEDDMPYRDWPQADKDAMARDFWAWRVGKPDNPDFSYGTAGGLLARADTRAGKAAVRAGDADARVERVGKQNTHIASLVTDADARVERVGGQNTFIITLLREILEELESQETPEDEMEK